MDEHNEIVEEVRAARDQIARQFDYDIDRLAAEMREKQASNPRPAVRLPPKRIIVQKRAG